MNISIRSSAIFCALFTILGTVVGRFFYQSESGSTDSGKKKMKWELLVTQQHKIDNEKHKIGNEKEEEEEEEEEEEVTSSEARIRLPCGVSVCPEEEEEEVTSSEARIRLPCGVSVCRTHGHASDTRRIRVRYATWRIVDQTVSQRIWIRLGHDGDTAGHGRDTTWTRRADFMGFFLLWA